jgi:3-isopropylmalate/(R)-2-methylmalate dehydratase large subunit
MGQTFAEKALARHAGLTEARPGTIVQVRPNTALSHDNTAAIADIFHEMGGKHVFDPEMHAIILDHATPAPTTKHAENHRQIREFVQTQGIPHFYDIGRGICHQVLVEEGLALPGELVLGSDSHTPHAGVMGAFAAGIGRSEMASVWALGSLWLRVPESIKITLHGTFPPWVTTKDLALKIIGQLGSDGALYQSVEWHGEALERLSLSERATLPNMMAEMGAKNSYLWPDATVEEYLEGRAKREYAPIYPDRDATYTSQISFDLGTLTPQVACPHNVDNVHALESLVGIPIQQAFLGTCTNGRLEDLIAAADILRGRTLATGTRMIVIPASSEVYLAADEMGLLADFVRAGAVVESPGCGPCMGNHMGAPAQGEVSISTANRNFRGRMGTKDSEIYLANPHIVAASAVAGKIVSPESLK